VAYLNNLVNVAVIKHAMNAKALPSVLWCCWLGGRKGIRPVKDWVVGCWRGYLSGASCRLAYGPADATVTHCLASVKSRLILPFWYRLTRVVLDTGPLNGCVCVCIWMLILSFTNTVRGACSVHLLQCKTLDFISPTVCCGLSPSGVELEMNLND